jgi:DNA-binding XRE family transcriptional regulator
MNKDLSLDALTKGEELWLWRRQQGLTLIGAAKRHGVSRSLYWQMENDRHDYTPKKRINTLLTLRPPSMADQVVLARRRLKWRTEDVAKKCRTSRVSLQSMEASADERLVGLYRGQGFRFTGVPA